MIDIRNRAMWMFANEEDYGEDDRHYYDDRPNPIFSNTFLATKGAKATIQIAALGFYVCRINDQMIDRSVLNGPWTNYQKIVYYDTIDVSPLLKDGENTIEIELGNGYYNPSPLKYFGKYNLRKTLSEVGMPKAWMQLYINGELTLKSDLSWKVREGNVLFNNLFLGEKTDLGKEEFRESEVSCEENTKHLVPRSMEPITEHERIAPKSFEQTKEGLLVDFQEMISGFIDLRWTAEKGQKVICQFAERKNADGSLDFFPNANGSVGEIRPDGVRVDGGPGAPEIAIEQDIVISKEGENTFKNKFSYHSFRYCLIKGLKKDQLIDIQAVYVHTDVKQVGHVETDNELIDQLYDAAIRTKLNNLHSSFEDCARERLGYGGDMVTLADSNLYTFDLREVYKKIVIDFINDQTDRGGYPETAPYMGIQSQGTANQEGPMLWQYVVPYLVNKLIQYYGEVEFAKECYGSLKKNMDYLLSWDIEELSHHDLGDHGSILIMGQFYKPTPDKHFAGYCTVLLFLDAFIRISKILDIECSSYEKRRDELKSLIKDRFKHSDGSYGEGTQTGIAFAAAIELEPKEELAKKLSEKIKEDHGIFNSGIFGTKFTYDLLHEYGHDDQIEYWLTQDSDISFKHMLSNGSKALAELFAGHSFSDNHAMFSSYVQWYYEALGGIKIKKDAVGFDQIEIDPYFSEHINEVECSIDTDHGKIISNWRRTNGKTEWELNVPEKISYTIKGSVRPTKITRN